MQDSLVHELQHLLADERITTLLQPIVDTAGGSVFGYEALSRGPSDSPLHSAAMLFETAERHNLTGELESLCLRATARSWAAHGVPQKLFVNVSPDKLVLPALNRAGLSRLLDDNGLQAEDIVIELSERYPTSDLAALQESLVWLRQQGFGIAIDDLGSGYSGLKLWSELKPDFVKIDRHFIRDIQDDLIKREFVRSVVDLSKRLDCKLIAEGVESEAEFRLIAELGIHLVQGFLFGRPRPMPTATLDPLLPRHTGRQWAGNSRDSAADLCRYVEPLAPDATLKAAWERLQREPSLFALPVVDNGHPLGLLHKWRVLETFSTPYGRALNERRAVTHLLSADALVVDHHMSLEDVSQRLIDEDLHYLKQHFIVVRDGGYAGLGATRSLLKQITARKLEDARYANPLTLLPGNVPIQKALESRLRDRQPFTLVYFDINHFKPLNDVLGYRAGDQVILKLGGILAELFTDRDDFVGHIGGDDFVVISPADDTLDRIRQAQALFVTETAPLYPSATRDAGFVECSDRFGQMARFPLVTLAAGLVAVKGFDCDACRTADQLAEIASAAKKRAKAAPGHLFLDTVDCHPPANAATMRS
ncbi:GGDEF domain-containing protein [Marinobacter xestospongiae]|uniref:GGDEF domain-containing protein n=1 Tax=Marinobacter xestospongiae TaxID=994319 RepID=A0ABU3VW67_9GAMM|nr:GGDEF domain-containing protein [Marinobacter xestospongiae]MDV2078504.1 GGDEF domain-containing protein [Marinobacter xestospongiae]